MVSTRDPISDQASQSGVTSTAAERPAAERPAAERPANNIRIAWAAIALAAVCLLWAGMVLNNGFNAGIKFTAPMLRPAVGMDVGRVTFAAFNKIEISWCVVTFCLLFLARPFQRTPRLIGVLLPLLWLVIALQTAFLLPVLVERALSVMHGTPVESLPKSPAHALYTSSELAKLIGLVVAGVSAIRQWQKPAASH